MNYRMKTLILGVAIACVMTPFVNGRAQAPTQGRPATPEQELKALDLAWHQAAAAHDVEALGRLLAEDYRFDLDARRMLTKAQEIDAVRASATPFDFGAFKLKDVTARVNGERASVSGILIVTPNGGDKKARRRYFYTRTFVSRDGRWQVFTSGLVTLSVEGG